MTFHYRLDVQHDILQDRTHEITQHNTNKAQAFAWAHATSSPQKHNDKFMIT